MRVQTGWKDDPLNFPGLAHFLEHMLFIGSHKYPKYNHYTDLIQDNGGETNAWTDYSNTCYYHSI